MPDDMWVQTSYRRLRGKIDDAERPTSVDRPKTEEIDTRNDGKAKQSKTERRKKNDIDERHERRIVCGEKNARLRNGRSEHET